MIALALAEDLGVDPGVFEPGSSAPDILDRDVTTASVVPADAEFRGHFVSRRPGVVAGLDVAARVYELLSRAAGMKDAVSFETAVTDGERVEPGVPVAWVVGNARVALAGERTALNFVMTLSGIATEAARWQREAGPSMVVVDTRKTYPGMRALSKAAVVAGGAVNHRQGLFDMVLIKDNHLHHAPGLQEAVSFARVNAPGLQIEVEAETVEQAIAAARAGADMVLLDNMDDELVELAVRAVKLAAGPTRPCIIEVSGGVAFNRLKKLAAAGVDRVSSSAITMAPPLDMALDEMHAL